MVERHPPYACHVSLHCGLLAGFVTVGYQAPPPSCASLRCIQGGIPCNIQARPWYTNDEEQTTVATVFGLDSHAAALNGVSNTSSEALCVVYDKTAPHDDSTTMLPWIAPNDTAAERQLLADSMTQIVTLCMDLENLSGAIDPDADPTTLTFNVSGSYEDVDVLRSEMLEEDLTLSDYTDNMTFSQLWAYPQLSDFCLSSDITSGMSFDVLCDSSVNSSVGLLSVSKTGSNIRLTTAADSGAVLFDADITAQQVSLAIRAMAGVFAFILLLIVIFLVKSKLF